MVEDDAEDVHGAATAAADAARDASDAKDVKHTDVSSPNPPSRRSSGFADLPNADRLLAVNDRFLPDLLHEALELSGRARKGFLQFWDRRCKNLSSSFELPTLT